MMIGCGGIGAWVSQALNRLMKKEDTLWLWDGDTVEKKNLDRQLFDTSDIGTNKALALQQYLGMQHDIKVSETYFQLGSVVIEKPNWIFVCADNHAARLAALMYADQENCRVIIGANETTSAEAYVYFPHWKEGPNDPRTYYPELLIDKRHDPLSPPCTGEILDNNPQLVMANMQAAAYMMWLHHFWAHEAEKLSDEEAPKECFPVRINSSLTKAWVTKLC